MTRRSRSLPPRCSMSGRRANSGSLGVTEAGSWIPITRWSRRAVEDGVWDVVMVAFHMMHQNARDRRCFPDTMANRVGTLLMFAVRNIFSRPERLAAALRELTRTVKLPRWLGRCAEPARFSDP